MIQHFFQTHSSEPTFSFICGIKGCRLHTFKIGATYHSFKSHASRKHPDWQHQVNEWSEEVPSTSSPNEANESSSTIESNFTNSHDDVPDAQPRQVEDESYMIVEQEAPSHTLQPMPTSSAALFLLTFQEKYKLSDNAIKFAVGAVQSIVEGVCTCAKVAVEQSLLSHPSPSVLDIHTCFENLEDPFSLLQTKHQQTKFYREVFGLIVS